jgi:hypothetical protein
VLLFSISKESSVERLLEGASMLICDEGHMVSRGQADQAVQAVQLKPCKPLTLTHTMTRLCGHPGVLANELEQKRKQDEQKLASQDSGQDVDL